MVYLPSLQELGMVPPLGLNCKLYANATFNRLIRVVCDILPRKFLQSEESEVASTPVGNIYR